MAFGKFFIPSIIGFNWRARPSFKSFCMSVTGLKSFESSYCVLKSPSRSDKKCCWMFCLVLRNSLTIKSLFLGSVICSNYMFFLSYLFYFSNIDHGFEHGFELRFEHCYEQSFANGFEHSFEHGFEHGFEHSLEHCLNTVLNSILNMVFNMVLNMSSSCSCRISIK